MRAVEEALMVVSTSTDAESVTTRSLAVFSLDTLGAALGRLLDAHALRFTDLLRLGDVLSRTVELHPSQSQSLPSVRVSHVGAAAVRAGDERATSSLATGLHGFLRLLSPEMPVSIKQVRTCLSGLVLQFVVLSRDATLSLLTIIILCAQFSLYALTSMLRTVEQLPYHAQAPLLEPFLSPACAQLLLQLPRNHTLLQLHAASFLNVVLTFAQQHPSLVSPLAYELWMQQIRHWLVLVPSIGPDATMASRPTAAALQIASAQCVRTLSSSPRGRLVLRESVPTMEALYDVARRLHDSVAHAAGDERQRVPSASRRNRASKSARARHTHTRGASATVPMPLDLDDAVAMQRHVSRAVRNVCTSVLDGAAALTSSSSSSRTSLLLHSKRTLPMSRVFRNAYDLSDLPVVGAEEYESSTEIGWIDILTSWAGSSHRDVRQNAIATLVHLAEADASTSTTTTAGRTTQDFIVQAWLTRMLQHVRHLSGGGEILAVKQVEAIAQLADGLTPGNEQVLFNPAVVYAGAEALAVLAEHHHDELLDEGVVPLMALLSESQHSTDTLDLQTMSTRVLANMTAVSCLRLSSLNDTTGGPLLRPSTAPVWQQSEADAFDVERLLLETVSGKRLLQELRQWGQWKDPMRRSSYFRAAQNLAAYRALVVSGRLEADVYCEGVHPIIPYSPTRTASTESTESTLDVVFIHGLRGHPFGTWRTDMDRSLTSTNDVWPDVLLASDLARHNIHARLVTLGYEAGMVSWSSPWPSLTLQERSHVMLDALYAANIGRCKRQGEQPAPVVFVTHSMGGILVKKMLLLAHEQAQARDNLAASTAGVVFLAVPHFGSDLANTVRSEAVRSLLQAHPALLDLRADADGRLLALNDAFRALGIRCMSIGEAKPAPLALGLSAVVVKPESADPGFGSFHVLADADHMTICKARTADEPHYRAILRFLLGCCGREDAAAAPPAP